MIALEYCKIRKRTDLLAILDEFADFNKQVLDIEYQKVDKEYRLQFDKSFDSE